MEEIKLGNEDRSTIIEDFIGKEFERGWKNFVKGIMAENERSNKRLYKILWEIKGQLFTTELDAFIKISGGLPQIRISKNPTGVNVKDNRWRSFSEIWIDQKQSPEGAKGLIYIQVKKNRWLKFHYSR
jgi:hypothetical protein